MVETNLLDKAAKLLLDGVPTLKIFLIVSEDITIELKKTPPSS